MIVMKFGGSSVANSERIRNVADIVKKHLDRRPVLVLSAMGDTTDHLLEAGDKALKRGQILTGKIEELHLNTIEELDLGDKTLRDADLLLDELRKLLIGISLIRELTPRTKDYLVSFGERLSARIVSAYFNTQGIYSMALDSWDAGIVTDSNFGSAELSQDSWDLIPEKVIAPAEEGQLQVITGYIAKDEHGNITTLGRGGSDLTATMIASCCGAEEVQVWKDVDGVLTADPRIVENTKPVETISFEAAAELAYFGAQVLHPRAMQPCMRTGTPALVKNSYNPEAPGTRIVASQEGETPLVQTISFKKNETLVDIVSSRMLGQHGFLAEVFSCFTRHGLSVDMVATSEVSVSLTLNENYDLAAIRKDLSLIASVEIKTGKAIVTIVGDVNRSSEILARSFRVCEDMGVQVQMISQGASKVNISFIVDDKEAPEVVKGLHKDFFE